LEKESKLPSTSSGVPFWASDAGSGLAFTIIAFVCVKLDPINTSASSDWTGVLAPCLFHGIRNGSTPPVADVPSVRVPVLIN
jgi:hypothetical protein